MENESTYFKWSFHDLTNWFWHFNVLYYFFNVAGHACSVIEERSEFKVKLLKEKIQHT